MMNNLNEVCIFKLCDIFKQIYTNMFEIVGIYRNKQYVFSVRNLKEIFGGDSVLLISCDEFEKDYPSIYDIHRQVYHQIGDYFRSSNIS